MLLSDKAPFKISVLENLARFLKLWNFQKSAGVCNFIWICIRILLCWDYVIKNIISAPQELQGMSLQEDGFRRGDRSRPQPGCQPTCAPCWRPAGLVLAGLEPLPATAEHCSTLLGSATKNFSTSSHCQEGENVSHHLPLRSMAWRVTPADEHIMPT